MMMYGNLDSFLNVSTWYTQHPCDEQRFFCALRKIVYDPDFNADRMGEYIVQKLNLKSLPEDHGHNNALNYYVAAAWAVKRYLEATDCD